MKTLDLIAELVGPILNRPTDDDLFTDPTDYEAALTRAEAYWYRMVATHYPDLLKVESSVITSADGGETYLMTDDHYGELEVYTPPGPPDGQIIVKTLPESQSFGFYVEGKKLKLTYKKDYNPGIYLRWVPATLTALKSTTTEVDPSLPAYFHDAYLFQAAYYLAQKPGFIGDAEFFAQKAIAEWDGNPNSISDAGLLGTLSRQYAAGGYESTSIGPAPWYKGISSQ
jgi:hypothetical protein